MRRWNEAMWSQKPGQLRNRTARVAALIMLMLGAAAAVPLAPWLPGTAAAEAAGGADAAAGAAPGITVYRTVHLVDRPAQTIPLIELVDPADPARTALAVVWQIDESGWFPSWRLAVTGDAALVPAPVQMGTIIPATGYTYDVAFAYEYGTGAIAFALYDADAERLVASYSGRINPSAGPLHARTDGAVQADAYHPVAVRWETLIGPEGAAVPASYVEDAAGGVWVRVHSDRAEPGTFSLVARWTDGEAHFALGRAGQGQTLFPIEAGRLPLGASELRLEYAVDGEVIWQSRPQIFRVGKVTAAVQNARVEGGTDLAVSLSLQGAAAGDVRFAVSAALQAMVWDESRKEYRQSEAVTVAATPEQVAPDGLAVRLALPGAASLGDQAPDAAAGIWRVRLSVTAEPDVVTEVQGAEFTVSTATGTVLGTQAAADRALRVCSYNILGFEGYPNAPTLSYLGNMDDIRRVNHYTAVLRSLGCDIVGIQEGRSVETMRLIAQTWERNLVAFPSATRFPGGIFTRYPVLEARVFNHAGPSNQNEPFSRFAGAALLDVDGTRIWVVNFHAWPHDEQMRVREAELLKGHLERLLEVTPYMIVMGDMNSQVNGPFDRMLRSLGLVNTMGLSWIGLRPTVVGGTAAIDHIYVTANLVPHVQRGWTATGRGFDAPNPIGSGEWYNSDHLPVLVELLWP